MSRSGSSLKDVDPRVSRRMSATKGQSNQWELSIRSALHRQGFRFRVYYRGILGSRRSIDIAFPARRVAVFLDGCFWHGCPKHATVPKTRTEFWKHKIATNRTRDRDTNRKLRKLGWKVIRVWSHESNPTDRIIKQLMASPPLRPESGRVRRPEKSRCTPPTQGGCRCASIDRHDGVGTKDH
jgi:DNA mismatch endonuclease (patch repair protein)